MGLKVVNGTTVEVVTDNQSEVLAVLNNEGELVSGSIAFHCAISHEAARSRAEALVRWMLVSRRREVGKWDDGGMILYKITDRGRMISNRAVRLRQVVVS